MNFAKIFAGTNTPVSKLLEGVQKEKDFQQGKSVKVITGYKTQKAGPNGSKQVPIYAYIPKNQPAPAPQQQQQQQSFQATPYTTSKATPSAASKKYLQEAKDTLAAADKTLADFNAAQSAAAKAQSIAASNQLMVGKSANIQLQPASGTPQTAGTQGFKKLKNQFKIKPSYNALNTIKSGTLNI